MISQILLVAMVLNVVLYVPSTLADATDLNAREFAVVLPFGAVLAARTLAAGLRARESRPRKWLAPVLLPRWLAMRPARVRRGPAVRTRSQRAAGDVPRRAFI